MMVSRGGFLYCCIVTQYSNSLSHCAASDCGTAPFGFAPLQPAPAVTGRRFPPHAIVGKRTSASATSLMFERTCAQIKYVQKMANRERNKIKTRVATFNFKQRTHVTSDSEHSITGLGARHPRRSRLAPRATRPGCSDQRATAHWRAARRPERVLSLRCSKRPYSHSVQAHSFIRHGAGSTSVVMLMEHPHCAHGICRDSALAEYPAYEYYMLYGVTRMRDVLHLCARSSLKCSACPGVI